MQDRETEVAWGNEIQRLKGALVGLVGRDYCRSITAGVKKLRREDGHLLEIEDDVKEALESGRHTEAEQRSLRELLAKYTEAVNHLWLYAEQSGITRKLASAWTRRNRRALQQAGIDLVDVDAEATFSMRRAVAKFEPGHATLSTYAAERVWADLDILRGRGLTPASVPVATARTSYTSSRHQLSSAFPELEEDAAAD